jgi:hypothetical protein
MDQHKLLKELEQAARTEAKLLDLRNKGLTSFPPGIAHLTSLTTLNLGNNQLSSLPPEIAKLTHVKIIGWEGIPAPMALLTEAFEYMKLRASEGKPLRASEKT